MNAKELMLKLTLWRLACRADQLDPYTQFAVFTPRNPWARALSDFDRPGADCFAVRLPRLVAE